MKKYEHLLVVLSLVCVAVVATGVNRCQEDYEFAADANVPTPTSTGDEGIVTRTATPSGTQPTATDTPDVADTPDETGTPEPTTEPPTSPATESSKKKKNDSAAQIDSQDFFGALALLGEDKPGNKEQLNDSAGGSKTLEHSANQPAGGNNWLGRAYSDNPDAYIDSDLDGFTDEVEIQSGSDPRDIDSLPSIDVHSSLEGRMRGADDDMDGLSNTEEVSLGADPKNADTDRDGANDGAEMRSGTSLLDPNSKPVDSDRDGLGDKYERARGLNPNDQDSDNDGLRDDIEYAIGANPMAPDTDVDGIMDGKEYAIGSDPVTSEQQAAIAR